jgi:hypothetical protein
MAGEVGKGGKGGCHFVILIERLRAVKWLLKKTDLHQTLEPTADGAKQGHRCGV